MMNYRTHHFAILCAFIAAVGLAGCNGEAKQAPKAEGVHHAEGGDDHGHEHGHAEEGPHHGHLIELGNEEYHAELTHDDATKTVTIYLLGKDAATAVAIADAEVVLNLVSAGKPLQVKLAATPQEIDPAGQASRFTIVDEAVLEALKAPETTGRLNVTIAETPYIGEIEHHEHGDHKH
jgi:hypothetical protein